MIRDHIEAAQQQLAAALAKLDQGGSTTPVAPTTPIPEPAPKRKRPRRKNRQKRQPDPEIIDLPEAPVIEDPRNTPDAVPEVELDDPALTQPDGTEADLPIIVPTVGEERRIIMASGGDTISVEKAAEQRGQPLRVFQLHDARVKAGSRSAFMGNVGNTELFLLDIQNVDVSLMYPQGPPDWDGLGSNWVMRAYSIAGGLVRKFTVKDWFGASYDGPGGGRYLSNEGHGFYLEISPQPGMKLVYEDCKFENMGGHPIYHTTAWDDDKALNQQRRTYAPGGRPTAAQPKLGGEVYIRRVEIIDTDQSGRRGAYALSFPDAFAKHFISEVLIDLDSPVLRNGVQKCNSRGALMANGFMEGLYLTHSSIHCADPSDRDQQVYIEGPEEVVFEDTEFDCKSININHPYGDRADGSTLKTKRFRMKNCSGRAKVNVNGKIIGTAADVDFDQVLI